jgi:hypothetical protein
MENSASCPVGKARKLLLVTDGTEHSHGAIREAIKFAKKCSSKLYAMAIAEVVTDSDAFLPRKIDDALLVEITKHLDTLKTQITQEGLACDTILAQSGEPYKVIIERAASRGVDMIIIGRKGVRGLKKLFVSEVAAQVIGEAPCNVLVVPKAAVMGPKTILIATDGSGHSLAAAEEGVAIAKQCDSSSVIVLSSVRSYEELEHAKANMNRVMEIAKKEGVTATGLTPTGRSYNVIVETAGGMGVDLIVMGIPVKTAFQKVFSGSATEQVIGNAGCAVLIVKGDKTPASV